MSAGKPVIDRSFDIYDDISSSNTNFPDDVWMDNKDCPSTFLGTAFSKKEAPESTDVVFNVVSNRGMLETEVWKTQMAIYDELVAASVTEREEKSKRSVKYEQLLKENEQLKKIQSENESKIEKLTAENAILKRNICSLYKTAKSESDRKDLMMLEINEELDSLRYRIKKRSAVASFDDNDIHAHNSKLNRDVKRCDKAIECKIIEPSSSTSRHKSDHTHRQDDCKSKDSMRIDKTRVKASENKSAKFNEEKSASNQSGHKSRDCANGWDSSRKRKRQSPYRSPCKYRHSYRNKRVTVEKSSYSYYKKSYGYHSASPRKSVDVKEIMKYAKTPYSSTKDYKRMKTDSSNPNSYANKTDKSVNNEKELAGNHNFHKNDDNSIFCDKTPDNNKEKNNKTKIHSFVETLTDLREVDKVSGSELSQNLNKINTYVSESQFPTSNLELSIAPVSLTSPTKESNLLRVTPETGSSLERHAGHTNASIEPPLSKVSGTPETLVTQQSSVEAEKSVVHQNHLHGFNVTLTKSVPTEESDVSIPVTPQVPFTAGNSTESKDTVLLQNDVTEINSNNDMDSVKQNVSGASSDCELANNAECNSKNKCLDILEDNTTTNALFFGLLPLEIRKSFMEYEQQFIVNTNRLKQSFVNYYFKHYKGDGPSTHSDEVLKEKCPADQVSHSKDVNAALFFFDERNKMAMSLNSNASPKTLSVNADSGAEPVRLDLVPDACDSAVPAVCSLVLEAKCSDNEELHSDSTKEIDLSQLNEIQKQLENCNNKAKDLPLSLNLSAPNTLESVSSESTSLPIAVTDDAIPNSVISQTDIKSTTSPSATKETRTTEIADSNVSALASSNVSALASSEAISSSSANDSSAVSGINIQTQPIIFPASEVLLSDVKNSVLPEHNAVDNGSKLNSHAATKELENVCHTVRQKSPSKLEICYRDVPVTSYPKSFNSVYYRRQLFKTALKEQEEDGLSKATREDLEKFYKFKNAKKAIVIKRKSSHVSET